MKKIKYSSKSFKEVLENTKNANYSIKNGLRDIKKLIKKLCFDCPYIEENLKVWFKKERR